MADLWNEILKTYEIAIMPEPDLSTVETGKETAYWDSYTDGLYHRGGLRVAGKHFDNFESADKYLNDKGFVQGKDKCGHIIWTNPEQIEVYETARKKRDRIYAARKHFHELAKDFVSKNGNPVFIRYGGIPKGKRSYNFRDNFYEAGVSVYTAYEINHEYVIIPAKNAFTFLGYAENKTAYLVNGDLCENQGSDGEPLLINPVVIKSIPNEKIISYADFVCRMIDLQNK